MSNLGIPQRLSILRARVRELLIDARWWTIVLINRRIDAWVYSWMQRHKDRI